MRNKVRNKVRNMSDNNKSLHKQQHDFTHGLNTMANAVSMVQPKGNNVVRTGEINQSVQNNTCSFKDIFSKSVLDNLTGDITPEKYDLSINSSYDFDRVTDCPILQTDETMLLRNNKQTEQVKNNK